MNERNENTMRTARHPAKSAALWASAFVIGALAIVQAGRLPVNPAYADQVTSEYNYTLMTSASGRSDFEVLYVLDSRAEIMLVYEIDETRKLVLRDGGSLRRLFIEGRR